MLIKCAAELKDMRQSDKESITKEKKVKETIESDWA